jgi:hypothetical protein
MPSAIEIANASLSLIGDQTITAFTDGTPRANLANTFYPIARDATLREHPWNFAEGRAVLAPIIGAPPFEYGIYYQLPTDCLRVRRNDDIDSPYRVEEDKVATDASEFNLVYTKRITDPNRFDSLFVMALIYRLAGLLAIPLLQDHKKAVDLEAHATNWISKAKGVDSLEGTPETFVQDDLTAVR